MNQYHCFDGNVVVICLEAVGLDFGGPGIFQFPNDERFMVFAKQRDGNRAAVFGAGAVALLEKVGFFPQVEKFIVRLKGTALQGDVGVLGQPRLLGFVVLLAGAMPVFDWRGFEVQPRAFREPEIGFAGAPINLKMKFWKWIIHDFNFCF